MSEYFFMLIFFQGDLCARGREGKIQPMPSRSLPRVASMNPDYRKGAVSESNQLKKEFAEKIADASISYPECRSTVYAPSTYVDPAPLV